MRPLVLGAGGLRAGRLPVLMGSLILGAFGLGAVEGRAAPPSSLAGETFTSREVAESPLTGTCPDNRNSTNGSFNFFVGGTASGPFPGTFVESGRFTTSPSGHLNDFSSTFTIKNTAGTVTVTGTKSLLPASFSTATCTSGEGGAVVDALVGTTYSATIAGVGQDTGAATVSMQDDFLGAEPQLLLFTENFGATGAVQTQCKHGGWKSFGTLFKNQGDCVSFFATRGKNPPNGS